MLAGAGLGLAPALTAAAECACGPAADATRQWRRGIEGQRQADQGDGTFIKPIIAGDHHDPTILKDGKDYYLTYSSFYAHPGLVIWHSTDRVNWRPVTPALHKPLGTIWAVDLCKHDGKYFIYIPAAPDGNAWPIHAIWADRIDGPWSEPVDLKISACIVGQGYFSSAHDVHQAVLQKAAPL